MGMELIATHFLVENKNNLLRAVDILTEALSLAGDSVHRNHRRVSCSMLLSYAYQTLSYYGSDTGEDLDQCIHFARMALQSANSVEPTEAVTCAVAGWRSLLRRGQTGDTDEALEYFLQGWACRRLQQHRADVLCCGCNQNIDRPVAIWGS